MVISLAVLCISCDQPSVSEGPTKGKWHEFSGDWSASGTRTTLQLGPDDRASIFKLSGSMLISGDRQLGVGFRAQAIGFSDRKSNMVGSSVWSDEKGNQAFSTLRGEAIGTSNRVTGTFVSGTGRYAGIVGEYVFQWQYVISAEEGQISGRAVNLKGRFRIDSAATNEERAR
jgi:hypothetical protein